ncbi:MAG: MBL fold metallo-hydrolase [bacterium]|nr:MBL fold metallo-hydrolase [bacterium]
MGDNSQNFYYLPVLVGLLFCFYANHVWALPSNLSVKFLDIGQGDSILITTPNGRTVLIDGGPGTTILERLGEETGFWLKKIDLMLLTHPDLDHLEGLVEVLQRYQVDRVMMTGVMHGSALYQTFLRLLENNAPEVILVDPSMDWRIDTGVYLDMLYPVHSVAMREVDNVNDTSIVFKLIYGESTMFLGGDIEEDTEHELLMTDFDLTADVYKAGHHGSITSNTQPLLDAILAEQIVITSGRDNQFNHPHLETVLRFDQMATPWINTKDLGTITLSSNGQEWSVVE